jgi:hypothetical protein
MLKHKIVSMKLSRLAPAAYNPRRISRKALEGLKASLSEFGTVQPIVFNKRTKTVVGGHQRIQALKALGETEAPVVIVDLDEKKERVLNVTLNNPKIEGEFTEDLDAILKEISKTLPAVYRNLRMDTLEASEKRPRHREGEVQFTEEVMEAHNYIVLYFENEIDWLHLQTVYPLPQVKAMDSKPGYSKIGIGRVVRGAEFLRKVTGK